MAQTEKISYYPKLVLNNNEHPSKLLAIPFIGILIKFILLIPVFIYAYLLAFAYLFFWLVLPFYIVFTGKYWEKAYNFFVGYARFSIKISLYLSGLTDKYPGFGMSEDGLFELHLQKPIQPNKWLAVPIVGFIVRTVLLIPYLIYAGVLQYGAMFAVLFSWFAVVFTGKYPVSLYEFNKDTLRISIAYSIYSFYLSDNYPSFKISMKHKTIKILLIVLGALAFLGNSLPSEDNADIHSKSEINKPNFIEKEW